MTGAVHGVPGTSELFGGFMVLHHMMRMAEKADWYSSTVEDMGICVAARHGESAVLVLGCGYEGAIPAR